MNEIERYDDVFHYIVESEVENTLDEDWILSEPDQILSYFEGLSPIEKTAYAYGHAHTFAYELMRQDLKTVISSYGFDFLPYDIEERLDYDKYNSNYFIYDKD